jgi:hypothetical protein
VVGLAFLTDREPQMKFLVQMLRVEIADLVFDVSTEKEAIDLAFACDGVDWKPSHTVITDVKPCDDLPIPFGWDHL